MMALLIELFFFFFNDTATTEIYTLSLHDALPISIALVTGGALGNLIDRIRSSRGVVDFFDFGFGDVRWPVFNVADIGVTVGALLLAVSLWREEQKLEKDEAVNS